MFVLVPSVNKSLADETGRADLEAELLRCSSKIIEHDVHQGDLLHFGRVDFKNSLFIALLQLWGKNRDEHKKTKMNFVWTEGPPSYL